MNADSTDLILAAEDFDDAAFHETHKFSRNDERVIGKLMSHGPVLLQGGRGSGKSALMIEAARRMFPRTADAGVIGIYISLRYLPLLRTEGESYEIKFCRFVADRFRTVTGIGLELPGECPTATTLQYAFATVASELGRRIVLLFDDAAHIGREASLSDFFDTFRTLSSSTVSCKATIYPGVTNFGRRFDVFNDATVVDVVRNEDQPGFSDLFAEVMRVRFPQLADARFSIVGGQREAAQFLATSVVGNMRGFVFACGNLLDHTDTSSTVGLSALGDTLLRLATNYYWPLLDEVTPKLGKYVPMIEPARALMEVLLKECAAREGRRGVLVHRDVIARMSKPFEILEYVGFLSRREASRALKSGGRGVRFAVNLCNLLEHISGSRLTSDLFQRWSPGREEPVEIHERSPVVGSIEVPPLTENADLAILSATIDTLAKSKAYPYGLTEAKISSLRDAGISTVGDLANASDFALLSIPNVGEAWVRRFRNVVGQAIWM